MKRCLITIILLAAPVALADSPKVTDVEASKRGDTWQFSVTVLHGDMGWDHYADAWEILAPDGTVLAVRELLHPHVGEQPFTRALSGVTIPESVGQVLVRARDNVHGPGEAVNFLLPR